MSRKIRTTLAAGAVLALAAGLTACGAAAEDDQHPDHRTFALQGRTLTVDSDDSELEIVAVDGARAGSVEVTRWFRGSVSFGRDPKVTWAMKKDRLVLRVRCSGVVADCSARHRIVVPRGVAVRVDGGNADVRASGFRDALGVRTDDGSVHVTDSAGALDLRTADGSVRAEVTSRRVRAYSDDGSVRLELGAVPDRVDTATRNGSVTVALPRAAYRVTAESEDGGVAVSVPRGESSAHVVSARSDDGKVTVRTAN